MPSERVTIPASAPVMVPPSDEVTTADRSAGASASFSTAAMVKGLNASQVMMRPYGVTTQSISSTPVTSFSSFLMKWYALKVTPSSSGPYPSGKPTFSFTLWPVFMKFLLQMVMAMLYVELDSILSRSPGIASSITFSRSAS